MNSLKDDKKVFFWKKYTLGLKSLVSSIACGPNHLLISTYTGSIYIYQLPKLSAYCFVSYKEITIPISKIILTQDRGNFCEFFAITKSGVLFYVSIDLSENMDVKSEIFYIIQRTLTSKTLEGDNEIIEAIFKTNSNIILFVSKRNIVFGIIDNEVKYLNVPFKIIM
jgi:hypothetical protein